MSIQWTKDELLLANEQVLAKTEAIIAKKVGKTGTKQPSLTVAYEATEDVVIVLACQLNRALESLRNIVTNAQMVPDSQMQGTTDTYAVPCDDIDAANAVIAICK